MQRSSTLGPKSILKRSETKKKPTRTFNASKTLKQISPYSPYAEGKSQNLKSRNLTRMLSKVEDGRKVENENLLALSKSKEQKIQSVATADLEEPNTLNINLQASGYILFYLVPVGAIFWFGVFVEMEEDVNSYLLSGMCAGMCILFWASNLSELLLDKLFYKVQIHKNKQKLVVLLNRVKSLMPVFLQNSEAEEKFYELVFCYKIDMLKNRFHLVLNILAFLPFFAVVSFEGLPLVAFGLAIKLIKISLAPRNKPSMERFRRLMHLNYLENVDWKISNHLDIEICQEGLYLSLQRELDSKFRFKLASFMYKLLYSGLQMYMLWVVLFDLANSGWESSKLINRMLIYMFWLFFGSKEFMYESQNIEESLKNYMKFSEISPKKGGKRPKIPTIDAFSQHESTLIIAQGVRFGMYSKDYVQALYSKVFRGQEYLNYFLEGEIKIESLRTFTTLKDGMELLRQKTLQQKDIEEKQKKITTEKKRLMEKKKSLGRSRSQRFYSDNVENDIPIVRKRDMVKKKIMMCLQESELNQVKRAIYSVRNIQSTFFDQSKGKYIFACDNLFFTLKRGEKIGVTGNDKRGIQGLMKGLIGEIEALKYQRFEFNGSIGFLCLEEAVFLVGKSIKENILFGLEYDPSKFECIQSTLKFDNFHRLSNLELLVAEKGKNLTEAERRIMLVSRLIYADYDIYIFSDLFSGITCAFDLDFFKYIIIGFLADKAVIFYTNEDAFLRKTSEVWYFHNGSFSWVGKYEEIQDTKESILHSLIGAKDHTVIQNASNLAIPVGSSAGPRLSITANNPGTALSLTKNPRRRRMFTFDCFHDKGDVLLYHNHFNDTVDLNRLEIERNQQLIEDKISIDNLVLFGQHQFSIMLVIVHIMEALIIVIVVYFLSSLIYSSKDIQIKDIADISIELLIGFTLIAVTFNVQGCLKKAYLQQKLKKEGIELIRRFLSCCRGDNLLKPFYKISLTAQMKFVLIENQLQLTRTIMSILVIESAISVLANPFFAVAIPIQLLWLSIVIRRIVKVKEQLLKLIHRVVEYKIPAIQFYQEIIDYRNCQKVKFLYSNVMNTYDLMDSTGQELYRKYIWKWAIYNFAAVLIMLSKIIAIQLLRNFPITIIGTEIRGILKSTQLETAVVIISSVSLLNIQNDFLKNFFSKLDTTSHLLWDALYNISLTDKKKKSEIAKEEIKFNKFAPVIKISLIHVKLQKTVFFKDIVFEVRKGELIGIYADSKPIIDTLFLVISGDLNQGAFVHSKGSTKNDIVSLKGFDDLDFVKFCGVDLSPSKIKEIKKHIFFLGYKNGVFLEDCVLKNIDPFLTTSQIDRIYLLLKSLRLPEIIDAIWPEIEKNLDNRLDCQDLLILSNIKKKCETYLESIATLAEMKEKVTGEGKEFLPIDPRDTAPHKIFFTALLELYTRNVLMKRRRKSFDVGSQQIPYKRGDSASDIISKLSLKRKKTQRSSGKRSFYSKKSKFSIASSFDHNDTEREIDLSLRKLEDEIVKEFLEYRLKDHGYNLHPALKSVVQVIRAIISDPKLIICDEKALKIEGTTPEFILVFLRQQLRDTAFLLKLDTLQLSERATKVITIKGGEMKDYGRPKDLFEQSLSYFMEVLSYNLGLKEYLQRKLFPLQKQDSLLNAHDKRGRSGKSLYFEMNKERKSISQFSKANIEVNPPSSNNISNSNLNDDKRRRRMETSEKLMMKYLDSEQIFCDSGDKAIIGKLSRNLL